MILVGFGATIFAISLQSVAQTKLPTPTPAKAYSSPREVFDALRAAIAKQDWRAVYYCHTREARDNLVFEAYFGCNMQLHNPKVLAVLKKYGADPDAITADYQKRYQEKHGVDIAQLSADRANMRAKAVAAYSRKQGKNAPSQKNPGAVTAVLIDQADLGPPLPRTDEMLFREVVTARVTDKAGFFEAANKIFANTEQPPQIGELTALTVKGNTALGHANKIIYHVSTTAGQPPKRIAQNIARTYHFRKSQYGWLFEREE
jgi:hypothetical protein